MIQTDDIIRLENITKCFGGVTALNNVCMEIRRGEIHAILGENGAGKSTLMKILAGVYKPDSGKIFLRGKEVRFDGPRDAQDRGISIVFQELNLFPQLSVAGNIFVNREISTKSGLLDERSMNKQSKELLDMLEVSIDPVTRLSDLSQGEKQIVEIARAFYQQPDIIIMDEPNSALNDTETQNLFRVIKRLKEQGVTILYISHRLEEVFQIADRISVFRDGNFMGVWSISETTMANIVQKMIGRRLGDAFPARRPLPETTPVSLEVIGLSKERHLKPIDFQVREGEVLGFAGLQGAGIDEIFQMLFGLEVATTGEIRYKGKNHLPQSTTEAIDWGWGLVPADRRNQGLMVDWSIRKNMSLVILDKLINLMGLVSKSKENHLVDTAVQKYRITTNSLDKLVIDLSGGNQQKVVVSKWLAINPRILFMNDPTRGIDIGAKTEIYSLINQLAEEGMTILFSSSEIDEVIGLCDRILVIYRGSMVKEFKRSEATKNEIMGYVVGSSIVEGSSLNNASVTTSP
jgi:ribose transport system ATP-binding protein